MADEFFSKGGKEKTTYCFLDTTHKKKERRGLLRESPFFFFFHSLHRRLVAASSSSFLQKCRLRLRLCCFASCFDFFCFTVGFFFPSWRRSEGGEKRKNFLSFFFLFSKTTPKPPPPLFFYIIVIIITPISRPIKITQRHQNKTKSTRKKSHPL